jgi:hypothetical protein
MSFKHNELSKNYIENKVGLSLESLTNLSSESVLFFLKNKNNIKIATINGLNYNITLENKHLTWDYLFTMHQFNIPSILYGKIGITDDKLDMYLSKKKKYIPVIKDILTCG